MFRILKAALRITLGGFSTYFIRLRWLYLQNKSNTNSPLRVHLLVVKKPSYSRIAQVCVESFLYYHPHSQIVIHADSITEKSLKKVMRAVGKRNDLEILIEQDEAQTWQEQKIEIIMKLSGTHDIFIDADLKWNGSMPRKSGVCFFVEEFIFKNNALYDELFRNMDLLTQVDNSMKNTSYFSWGGEWLNPSKRLKLLEFIGGFQKQVDAIGLPTMKRDEILRIVEQLGLSIMFERRECSFLKEKDTQFDGSFVESSYYGATGTKFGKFGITSRKF